MAAYPTTFTPELQFFTSQAELGIRANQAIMDLADHGFVVAAGMHTSQVDTLAETAVQDHIEEYCPNDGQTRFVDETTTLKWLGKNGGRGLIGIYNVDKHPGYRRVEDFDINKLSVDDVSLVAYGWSGNEANKHVPGADITTAYRVGHLGRELAYERRFEGAEDKFKLGLPLGELVIASAVVLYGADPAKISLETWQSNRANTLYDTLGFVEAEGTRQEDIRPTLRPVGTEVNGNEVYYDEKKRTNMVADVRLFKTLVNHPLVDAI